MSEQSTTSLETSFGLSPQQKHVWRLARELPSLSFHTTGVIEAEGSVETARLERALGDAVGRFEILRTSFGVLPGTSTPVQSPLDEVAARIEVVDLSDLPEESRDERLAELRATLDAPDFAADSGDVFRATIARLGDDRHVLFVGFPTLCGDALTVDALAANVAAELDRGDGAEEAELMQYADLAQWLHDLFESDEADAGLAHWRLVDWAGSDPLRLPGELRPIEGVAATLARHRTALEEGLHASVTELAERFEVAPAAIYQAVFAIQLSRLAGSAAFHLGLGVAGRGYEGLAQTPGLFWKSVPMELRVDPDEPFATLARRLDADAATAGEWQEYFDWARVSDVGDGEPPSILFDYHASEETASGGGVTLRVAERASLQDYPRLRLVCDEHARGMTLAFDYDGALLDEASVSCFAGQLQTLLRAIVHRPDDTVGALGMLGADERRRLIEDFGQGPPNDVPAGRIHAWIAANAASSPSAPAVVTSGGRLTYAELEEESNRLARYLRGRGVGPGSFVGIHLDRSPELLVSIVAVLKAGGAYVPLPHGYPPERLAFMASDSGAALVLTRSDLRDGLPGGDDRLVCLDSASGDVADQEGGALDEVAGADDPAYVIYTSGSTGKPKGVVITHANLAHSTAARPVTYGTPGPKAYLLLASVAFDSSVPGIFWTLATGGKLVLPRDGFEEELASLPALIEGEGITHILGLPSLWGVVLESAGPGQLAGLDTFIVAGESCSTALVERHFHECPGTRLFNEYGPTEGTVWSTVQDCSEGRGRYRVPIGRPVPGVSAYVVDEGLEPTPIHGDAPSSTRCASPKSATLASPSLVTNTLWGLKSRCAIPCSWAATSPRAAPT